MLKFNGIGSAFNYKLGNNSAFIKDNDKLFLIDCGSSTFHDILDNGSLDGVSDISVFITHTHADHVGSLGDLIFYTYFSIQPIISKKIKIYSGTGVKVKELLEINGCHDGVHYDLITLNENQVQDIYDFSIKPIRVNHYKGLETYALELLIDNEIIYYSADADKTSYENFDVDKYDLIFIDTSKAHFEGNPHLSLIELINLVPLEKRGKVFCMHLDINFNIKEANDLGFNVVSRDSKN